MKKYITIIFALVFSLNVSAQTRASVNASVTIVDVAGTSFFTNSYGASDSISSAAYDKDATNLVRADQTADLGKLSFIGTAAYSITLPTEPIILSRISGKELLTVQSLKVITSENNSNAINIIATCNAEKAQVPGLYAAIAPIDIVIDYN